ncbi:MAG: helix-turn-helix domain-containing protein [Deltaproteobacteria bacterium]|nr:helix-turn-helix domain-containing protein [Deltaproteobacteria bacterium]
MREAREAKGLSLDDVFEKTKLRPAVVRIVLPNQRIDRPWPMRSRPFCLKI